MIEGFYGQHSGTGKWYAEIFHPEFGPITQWGDDTAEATRKVEQYVRLNWDPGATEFSWAPYEVPLLAGKGKRLGADKKPTRPEALRALEDIHEILRKYVTPLIPDEGELADRVDRIHEDTEEISNVFRGKRAPHD
jgi:hypothetical protein